MSSESSDWNWKLRLFTSADLVGSTAYKASKTDSRWAPTFKEFFSEFPSALANAYNELPEKFPTPPSRLQSWKFSGDEILSWVQLNSSTHVPSHLWAFKKAVNEFPGMWKFKELPLKLKATAWLAGFPVTNTEIRIAAGEHGSAPFLDFIGPSMDLGFRIAKYTTVRQFVISADLALMLLDASDHLETDRKLFQLHLHGLEPLKGVIDNEPYPIFWIDMRDGAPLLEETLLGVRRDFRADDIKEYLRSFIDGTPKLRRPFIENDQLARYSAPDKELEELRQEMQAEGTLRFYTDKEPPETQGEERVPRAPLLTLSYF